MKQEAKTPVRIPDSIWEAIKTKAAEDDRSGAWLVRKILKDYLTKEEKRK